MFGKNFTYRIETCLIVFHHKSCEMRDDIHKNCMEYVPKFWCFFTVSRFHDKIRILEIKKFPFFTKYQLIFDFKIFLNTFIQYLSRKTYSGISWFSAPPKVRSVYYGMPVRYKPHMVVYVLSQTYVRCRSKLMVHFWSFQKVNCLR